MTAAEQTIQEIDFCARVASAANGIFAADPDAFPFHEARVAGSTTATCSNAATQSRP